MTHSSSWQPSTKNAQRAWIATSRALQDSFELYVLKYWGLTLCWSMADWIVKIWQSLFSYRPRWSADQHLPGIPVKPGHLWSNTDQCWPGGSQLVLLLQPPDPGTTSPCLTAHPPAQRTALQHKNRKRDDRNHSCTIFTFIQPIWSARL